MRIWMCIHIYFVWSNEYVRLHRCRICVDMPISLFDIPYQLLKSYAHIFAQSIRIFSYCLLSKRTIQCVKKKTFRFSGFSFDFCVSISVIWGKTKGDGYAGWLHCCKRSIQFSKSTILFIFLSTIDSFSIHAHTNPLCMKNFLPRTETIPFANDITVIRNRKKECENDQPATSRPSSMVFMNNTLSVYAVTFVRFDVCTKTCTQSAC